MHRHHYNQPAEHQTRTGFTLVELLVSVTLVLLLMTMFTAIFSMATDSVTTQRGIARNDQRARALTTMLRADIAKRTFQNVQPFRPGETAATSATDFGDRSGYIYISTNDPNSTLDDMLQLTVNASLTDEETDDERYYGAAKLLYDWKSDPSDPANDGLSDDNFRNTTLRFNANQPDADDGDMYANNVGTSPYAEVCYFVRRGALYRRVSLIRDPLNVSGDEFSIEPETTQLGSDYFDLADPSLPTSGGAFAYVASPLAIHQTDATDATHFSLAAADGAPTEWNVTASNDFWRHFDFSAVPANIDVSPFPGPSGVEFVGINALSNDVSGIGLTTTLGHPRYRFGFNGVTSVSREHDNPADLFFIGRFLQAETSHEYFNWPLAASRIEAAETIGSLPFAPFAAGGTLLGDDGAGGAGNGNPMDLVGTQLHLNQSTGVVTELSGTTGRGGPRRGEDLLLADVHEFKIEIWDDKLEKFVSPSHNFSRQIELSGGGTEFVAGQYHASRQNNVNYGPLLNGVPARNNVFDSWTSTMNGLPFEVDFDGGGSVESEERSAPFMPYRYAPPRASDPGLTAGATFTAPNGPGPSPDSMTNPYEDYDVETGENNKNKGFWIPSDFSDALPANWTYQNYAEGDIVFAVTSAFVSAGVVGWDAHPAGAPDGQFDWEADSNTAAGSFPGQGFAIAYRCVRAGYAGATAPSFPRVPGQVFAETADASATGDPAEWVSIDNRRPLRAIKITVQFYDEGTENLRQLSLVLPLTTDR